MPFTQFDGIAILNGRDMNLVAGEVYNDLRIDAFGWHTIQLDSGEGDYTITGLLTELSPLCGTVITIQNLTSNLAIFKHDDSRSLDRNRLRLPLGQDVAIGLYQSITLRYDTVGSRWDLASRT